MSKQHSKNLILYLGGLDLNKYYIHLHLLF